MEKNCSALEGTSELEDQICLIQDVAALENSCGKDNYSRLRYARAIVEMLPLRVTKPFYTGAKHPIWDFVLCELGLLGLLRQGWMDSG